MPTSISGIFRLNFETNAVIYDERVAGELKQAFIDDLSVPVRHSLPNGMHAVPGCSGHGLHYPVSSPPSCNPGILSIIDGKTGLFKKIIEVALHPVHILFIVNMQGGDGVRDVVPGNHGSGHPFVKRVCR